MGLSAGSASAFSEQLATKEEVEAVYRQVMQKVTVQPFGFSVTESAHSKPPAARGRFRKSENVISMSVTLLVAFRDYSI